MYQNARPLDLALWQYHFENGSRDTVLSILQCYQNSDGGFGNTIDPDNWNPDSTAYNAQIVIKMLRQIDFVDATTSFWTIESRQKISISQSTPTNPIRRGLFRARPRAQVSKQSRYLIQLTQ